MLKRMLVLLTLLAVCLTSLAEGDLEITDTVVTEDAAAESIYAPLPIDFTPGPVPDESAYTENGYDDGSLRVTVEKVQTEKAIYNVARVKISDPSQFRTAVTPRGRTNKISALAENANAVVAIGGEYFATDDGGYIVRMGEVQADSKKKARKSPYETRDLLAIDENGDLHILLRKRNGKPNNKSINPDFTDQLRALTEVHTLVNVFDFGPALVIDGVKQEQPEKYSFNLDGREPRCAIGQTGPLEYALVVVDTVKHHDRSGKEGATYDDLAQFMADLGCQQAYNLDGGNSALMVFHGANYSDKTVKEERSVSDIIYFATLVGQE